MTRIDRLNDIAKLLDDGFSEKYAQYYLNLTEIELNSNAYDQKYVKWAHSKGFLAESACVYGLNETNYEYYLSDYDYYRIWPLNSWSRIWVNDKLTLKTMLCDGDFKDFMPEYYWYMQDKHIKPLMDIDVQTDDFQRAFVQHLSSVGEYACKPCNGTGSVGFVRIISLGNSQFKINSEKTDVHGLLAFVNSHPNYIYTEYIHPPLLSKCQFFMISLGHSGLSPLIVTAMIQS